MEKKKKGPGRFKAPYKTVTLSFRVREHHFKELFDLVKSRKNELEKHEDLIRIESKNKKMLEDQKRNLINKKS